MSASRVRIHLAAFLGLHLLMLSCQVVSSGEEPVVYQVRAGSALFHVEVATSPAEKQLGLMHRASLAENHGLLMVFSREQRTPIWMKNMQFPIDVIWLSSAGHVVDRATLPVCETSPCTIHTPEAAARYVLEVAAGRFPLDIGDKVEILDVSGDSLLPPEFGIIAPRDKY